MFTRKRNVAFVTCTDTDTSDKFGDLKLPNWEEDDVHSRMNFHPEMDSVFNLEFPSL